MRLMNGGIRFCRNMNEWARWSRSQRQDNRVVEPALYGVSVRSLAALVGMRPTAKSGRLLRTHSQASSPRSVALPQLPSPSAC